MYRECWICIEDTRSACSSAKGRGNVKSIMDRVAEFGPIQVTSSAYKDR